MNPIIPTVKTWCLPDDLEESRLLNLHRGIVSIMSGFPETGIRDERDMLNLFPRDLMTYGLGSEIKIKITDLPTQCNKKVLNTLIRDIREFIKSNFPKANIYCTAKCFNYEAGAWSSK